MSLWAVKDAGGKFLCFNDFSDPQWDEVPDIFDNGEAESLAEDYRGHVVELVEKPTPVVVSQEEADMLERLRTDENVSPAGAIRNYFWGSVEGQNVDNKPRWSRENEARLMRAYVNGYTVGEKPKRYVLPMPGTEYHSKLMHGNAQYYAIKGTGNWRPDATALGTDDAVKHGYTVTKSEIDTAPGWVKTITPVEVTDDDD